MTFFRFSAAVPRFLFAPMAQIVHFVVNVTNAINSRHGMVVHSNPIERDL